MEEITGCGFLLRGCVDSAPIGWAAFNKMTKKPAYFIRPVLTVLEQR